MLNFLSNPFLCIGCNTPSQHSICQACLPFLRLNHRMLFDMENNPTLKGIFPLYVSLSITHKILSHWKNRAGQALERQLLRCSPQLLEQMRNQKFDVIVYIPQKEAHNLKRGHRSAFKIAQFFSRHLNVPIQPWLTLQEKHVPKQAYLSAWDRQYSENNFQVAKIQPPTQNFKVLLVDDFITTGNTIAKAAHTLKDALPHAILFAGCLGWKPKTVLPPKVR